MTLSIPGLIGAAVGILIALGAYVAILPLLKRSGVAPNVAALRTLLLADFVVLAVVGYLVGQMLE